MRAAPVIFGIAVIIIGLAIAIYGYAVGYGGAWVPQLVIPGVIMVLGGLFLALRGALAKAPQTV